MFASQEACENRTKLTDRRAFELQHDVHSDLASLSGEIREHLRRSPATATTAATAAPAASKRSAKPPVHPISDAGRRLADAVVGPIAASPVMPRRSVVSDAEAAEAAVSTLTYLFERHKLGIWVSIRGNRVVRYASFVNRRYRNPLARLMRLDPGARAPVNAETGAPMPMNRDGRHWFNFDCLVFGVVNNKALAPGERPTYEPHHSHAEVRRCLDLTCASRPVPDCDFFVNLQDQLVLRADLCVPHLSITGSRPLPIPGLDPRTARMAPVFSFCGAAGYLDVPFVFPDDVARAMTPPGASAAVFAPRCKAPFAPDAAAAFVTDWDKKTRATAVFRGSATGCGWTPETNPRLYLALESWKEEQQQKDQQQQSPPLLDVKLTGTHNPRYKKHETDRFVRFVTDPRLVSIQSDDHALTLAQQSEYKYIVDLPGNVVAYRLTGMFALGSVVIVVEHPRYRPWMRSLLLDRENCMLLQRPEQVPDAVRWLRAHDDEARRIAANGLELHRTAFSADALMDYTAGALGRLFGGGSAVAKNTKAKTRAKTVVKTVPKNDPRTNPKTTPTTNTTTNTKTNTKTKAVAKAKATVPAAGAKGSRMTVARTVNKTQPPRRTARTILQLQ